MLPLPTPLPWLMLLAEVEPASSGGAGTITMVIVTALSNIAGGVLLWLRRKDSGKFMELKFRMSAAEEKAVLANTALEAMRRESQALQGQVVVLTSAVQQCEGDKHLLEEQNIRMDRLKMELTIELSQVRQERIDDLERIAKLETLLTTTPKKRGAP